MVRFTRAALTSCRRNVIWLADTNYRIDLDNASVRSFVERDDYDPLIAADQLRQVMDMKVAFSEYQEGPLLFRPTYRYDLGTDNYDTSEKMRIPAWTDRILHRGNQLNLNVYSRAELRGSDHKPVFAIYGAEVRIIDRVKKATLSQMLLESIVSLEPGEKLDKKLAKLAIPRQLPPPSSDENSWWNTLDCPAGVVPIAELEKLDLYQRNNPFDSSEGSSLTSSPSSSDEELYTHALALPTPMEPVQASTRRPPPPPPR